uniref:Uncharacterized protein n=1 Tax=Sphaerodactylus townsendi TaxID=933632 RepID=A0ACB8FP91_9SAUR
MRMPRSHDKRQKLVPRAEFIILTRAAILRGVSAKAQEMTPPTVAEKCPGLISGVSACAGLVLVMAAVLVLVIWKQNRRMRKRKADEESPKKIENYSISFENQVNKGPILPREDNFAPLKCPQSNDTSQRIILKDAISKTAGSDVTEAASLSSCEEKGNHTFPLPATELGATVLVTTKTTQENFTKEELL